ncbi:MAG: hypothetical protein ACOZE5_18065 [Verrucomicrobiota bacterium]
MPAPSANKPASAATGQKIVLLPATKFFVRRIPLAAGQDVGAQAELALETIGPFAPGQLYHGCHVSPDGTEALVFAAYRRNFPPAETSGWPDAEAVLPAFAFWLGQSAPSVPEVWLHEHTGGIAAIFWDGRGKVPAGVIVHETNGQPAETVREELTQEARRRLDASTAAVRLFQGDPVAGELTKEGLTLTLGDRVSAFTTAQLRGLDVRDKAELAARLIRGGRDRRLWLGFAATAAVLAACLAGELGLAVSRGLLGRQRTRLESAGEEVRRIEQANQLVVRMEQLAGQSLQPFEMLALLNSVRPASLEFVRASTVGPLQMEIEAQSGNASDPQSYEQALRRVAAVGEVELRNLRTSGGRTTFLVAVGFKPGFAGQGGAR